MPRIEGQAVIVTPSGTAPLAVTSQALCSNLNADLLDGYGSSAFAWANHVHPASHISNATTAGIALLTAAEDEEQRRSLQLSSLSGEPTIPIEAIAFHRTRINSGGSVSTRRRLNLIQGSNVTLSIADDPANDETDVTINSTASGGSGGPLSMFAWVVARWTGSAWTILNGWNVSSISAASGLFDYWRVSFDSPAASAPYVCESAYTRNDTASAYLVLPQLFNNMSDNEDAGIVLSGYQNVFPPQTNDVMFLKFFTT
jgi:hypothetical protein